MGSERPQQTRPRQATSQAQAAADGISAAVWKPPVFFDHREVEDLVFAHSSLW